MTGLTDIPQDQMEEAMQRACDEQAEVMAGTGMTLKEAVEIVKPYVPKSDFDGQDKNVLRRREYEKRQVRETNQEKSKLDAKETYEFIKKHYGDVLRRLADS